MARSGSSVRDVTAAVRRSLSRRAWACSVGLAAWIALPAPVDGQGVLVRVVERESSRPVAGAVAALLGERGQIVRRTLTDERGRALFVDLPGATYRIRAEMIGMEDALSDPFPVGPESQVARTVRMVARPIELAGLDVTSDAGRCVTRPADEGLLVARLWDEARKALTGAALTTERSVHRFETLAYERDVDRRTGAVVREDRAVRGRWVRTPFESHPATDLIENGFVQPRDSDDLFMAPDAAVLLSDLFLDTHCFHLVPAPAEEPGIVGLGFRPTADRGHVPDIAGTLWIDADSAMLRWLEYTYQYLEPGRTAPEVGGRVEFRRMPDGAWIVPEWEIRMPVVTVHMDARGRRTSAVTAIRETGGIVLDVREGGGRQVLTGDRTGGIEGVVRDSLGAPVRGVTVGLVGSNQTVFTDSDGRFGITRLPEGRYEVVVSDSALGAAGHDPIPVPRDVVPGEMSSLPVFLPSTSEVLHERCRSEPRGMEEAILAGIVVDQDGKRVEGATVEVAWNRYNFSGVVSGRQPSDLREVPLTTLTTSDELGRYAFCDVPMLIPIRLRATDLGGSELLELKVPGDEVGVVRVLRLVVPRT